MKKKNRHQGERGSRNNASPKRHEYDDDQKKQGDGSRLEMKPERNKGDHRQADDADQKMRGGIPESTGRALWQVRPVGRRMSIVNPAHLYESISPYGNPREAG